MFPLGFRLVRIYPNDEFIEIFAQIFQYFEDPFYKFFALNLLFQDTSCSLALKYSSFCLSFSVLHFMILIFGPKSVKFAQKFRIFLEFFTLEGTLLSGKSIRLWSCRLGFDTKSGQTNDCKIGIHSFLA